MLVANRISNFKREMIKNHTKILIKTRSISVKISLQKLNKTRFNC